MERIVVGVDGSERSVEALRWAATEAARRNATLQVVMTWDSPYPDMWLPSEPPGHGHLTALRHQLDGIVHGALGDPPPAGTETYVADGPPAKVLVELSGDADLLVVGNRGRGGFAGVLLGSVGRQCVLHAACPVVVVRGAGPVARTEDPRATTTAHGSGGAGGRDASAGHAPARRSG